MTAIETYPSCHQRDTTSIDIVHERGSSLVIAVEFPAENSTVGEKEKRFVLAYGRISLRQIRVLVGWRQKEL